MKNIIIFHPILLFILHINYINVIASTSSVEITRVEDNVNIIGSYQEDKLTNSDDKLPMYEYEIPFTKEYTNNDGAFSITAFAYTLTGKFCGGLTVERHHNDLSKIHYRYTRALRQHDECNNFIISLILADKATQETFYTEEKKIPIEPIDEEEKVMELIDRENIFCRISVKHVNFAFKKH